MRHTLCLLIALAAAPAGGRAAAPDVAMPGGKKFQEKPVCDDKGRPRFAWVAHADYPLKRLPGDPAPAGHACRYMEPFVWLDSFQPGDGRNHLLLAKADDKGNLTPYGWVEQERCCGLLGTECLTDDKGIQRKAFLVNTLAALTRDKDLGAVRPSLVPECPAGAAASEALMLSNVLFIYAEFKAADGPTFLVGTEPEFNQAKALEQPDRAANVVLGWVPGSRVFQWRTREALEVYRPNTLPGAADRRTRPVMVFETAERAIDALKERGAAPPAGVKEPLFVENLGPDGVSPEIPHSRMRFPLAELEKKYAGFSSEAGGGLYKVGCVGPLVDPANPGSVLLAADRMEDLKRQMGEIKEQLAVTEILFVIDGTDSMRPGFAEAAAAVKKIIESAKADPAVNVRVGVAIYRDLGVEDETAWAGPDPAKAVMNSNWRDNPAWVEKLEKTVEVWPLADAASPEAAAYLDRMKKCGDGKEEGKSLLTSGGYALEQVFHGIQRGVARSEFKSHSRKMVVVIGDMGDHRADADGAEARKIVAGLVPPARKKSGRSVSPMEFYALQTCPAKTSADAQRFRDQMDAVCAAYNAEKKARGLSDAVLPNAKAYPLAEQAAFHDAILRRYADLKEQSAKLPGVMQRFQNGQFAEMKSAGGLQDILKATTDLPVDTLTRGIQVFHEGYVTESHDKKCQVKLKYLMSEAEARDLDKGMKAFFDRWKREEEKAGAGDALALNRAFLAALVGDEVRPDERGNYDKDAILRKFAGLGSKSALLDMIVKVADDRKADVQLQDIEDMRWKWENLKAARDNKRVEWAAPKFHKLSERSPVGVMRREAVGDKVPADRVFPFPFSKSKANEWIWIDHETELP